MFKDDMKEDREKFYLKKIEYRDGGHTYAFECDYERVPILEVDKIGNFKTEKNERGIITNLLYLSDRAEKRNLTFKEFDKKGRPVAFLESRLIKKINEATTLIVKFL